MSVTLGILIARIPWYHDSNKVHWSVGAGLHSDADQTVRLDYAHGDKNKFHFSFGGRLISEQATGIPVALSLF